ncbi:MAG: hypothetical protein HY841_14425 [Bacteroidetes bacterium]|nr:hypothetical protein [Bacteroidota bacterium]
MSTNLSPPAMSTSDLQKKKHFFLKNENFFWDIVSFRYGFKHSQLRQYKTILKWDKIVSNESIEWSIEIVKEFKEFLFREENIFELCCNESLPWTIEFLQRYENLWSWELLAQNTCVMCNPTIRKYYYSRLYPYFEDYLDRCSKDFNNVSAENQKFSDEVERDAQEFSKHKELQFQYPKEILNAQDTNWYWLSHNILLPWSAALIEKYIDQWNWTALGRNESIPWDLELLKKFEHKIDWTMDFPDAKGKTATTGRSISYNMSIEWDSDILSTFRNRLDKFPISMFGNGKWNIDLVIQFNNFWDMDVLYLNKAVWEKTFPEFHTEERLIPFMDYLVATRYNQLSIHF